MLITSMPSHPNRGPKGPSSNPTPAEVRAAREAAKLTQEQAGALVHSSRIGWARWESEGQDARRMHPGLWELFRIKVGFAPIPSSPAAPDPIDP